MGVIMKKLFLAFLLVSQVGFAVTANKVWRVPSGGTLPAWGPVNLADGTNAVTGTLAAANVGTLAIPNIPAISRQVSSVISFSSSSTGTQTAAVSITTSSAGHPVMVALQGNGNNACFVDMSKVAQSCGAEFTLKRSGTAINVWSWFASFGSASTCDIRHAGSELWFLDTGVSASTSYSYLLELTNSFTSSTSTFGSSGCVLAAWET